MEKIYSTLKIVETQVWQVKAGKFLTVVISRDLFNVKVVVYKLSCILTSLTYY